ncbi:MAG: hypothetical protein LQ346_008843 [Caloplaca aetnensis]|nr:MAG: hypothetical protein LQ346_008843 [Caloplaca aetnensis]
MVASTAFVNQFKPLGIRPEASSTDVRKAYHQCSLQAHPDKHPASQSQYWNQVQLKINAAKDVLMNPEMRASYDHTWTKRLERHFNSGGKQKPPHARAPPRPSQPSQPSQPPRPPQTADVFIPFATPEDIDVTEEWLSEVDEDDDDDAEGYASRYANDEDCKKRPRRN